MQAPQSLEPEQKLSSQPPQKINFKNVRIFLRPNNALLLSSLTTLITTFLPAPNHHDIPKPPQKTPAKTKKPRLSPGPTFFENQI
jgi:hypothetical protein